MKLKEIYEKIYKKIVAEGPFKFLLKIPAVEKLLQYEIVSYLVFGVLTTVVNLIVYGIMGKIGGEGYKESVLFRIGSFDFLYIYLANAVAWIVAVAFAYVTNKLFVFESRSWKAGVLVKEIISFIGARILSFLLFEELMFGVIAKLLENIKYGDWIAKLITAVLVVIFNFVASKLVIFRKKKSVGEAASSDETEAEITE